MQQQMPLSCSISSSFNLASVLELSAMLLQWVLQVAGCLSMRSLFPAFCICCLLCTWCTCIGS
jgi:hypothetical protein